MSSPDLFASAALRTMQRTLNLPGMWGSMGKGSINTGKQRQDPMAQKVGDSCGNLASSRVTPN